MIMSGFWEYSNSGHVFIAEKHEGRIVYVDPQTGRSDADMYIGWMQPKSVGYFEATGLQPMFLQKFKMNGVELPKGFIAQTPR